MIASFNHAPYLRRCIDSVLDQSHPPAEIVVIDDGSTDGSREIISEYGNRVTALFQENAGTYAALNAGFERATGDWIAVQNSDDVWAPDKLARQAEIIERSPHIGIVHTGFACIDENGRQYGSIPPEFSLPDYHGSSVSEMLPTMIRSMPVIISSAVISRAAWSRFGPFDPRFHGMGDWDLCLRVSQELLFGFIDLPLTLVRKHSANASTDPTRIPADWTKHDWRFLGLGTMPAAAQTLFDRARSGSIQKADAAFALACLATIYSWGDEPKLARSIYALAARLAPGRIQTYLRAATTFLPHSIRTRIR